MLDGVVTEENIAVFRKFMQLCKGRPDQLRDEIQSKKVKHNVLMDQLTVSHSAITQLERKLNALLAGQIADPTDDLMQIAKLEKLDNFKVESNKIIFDVKSTFIVDPRKQRQLSSKSFTHRIGRVRVKLDLVNQQVYFNNLDYTVLSVAGFNWNIPHADNNGIPCWGTGRATIDKCFTEMKFYNLIMMCIVFIESVNTADDAGRYLGRWPRVNDDNKIEYCPHYVTMANEFDASEFIEIPFEEYKSITDKE